MLEGTWVSWTALGSSRCTLFYCGNDPVQMICEMVTLEGGGHSVTPAHRCSWGTLCYFPLSHMTLSEGPLTQQVGLAIS
jgi:hypothetical protein